MDVKDQVAIHEAMEQQTISITKGEKIQSFSPRSYLNITISYVVKHIPNKIQDEITILFIF